jgi:hypothetical protein
VTLVEEAPRTLLVSWDPPDVGTADTYNIYWDTEPGVTLDDNELADVESPYLHSGLTGNVTYYYAVAAIRTDTKSPLSAEVSGTPHGGGGGGGGGHTEGYGNNLSFPLVFADGYGLGGLPLDGTVDPWLDHATGLRPTAEEVPDVFPHWDPGSIYELNGVPFYEQQTESTWQADWTDGSQQQQEVVLDWGDNLTSVSYRTESMIRVETVLYQDTSQTDPEDTLTAYEMALLHGSGATEMQGTNQHTYESNVRHVYAVNARLRIQKLLAEGGPVDETVNGFDAAVYQGFGEDGPGSYGSEVNVAGKVVYGYVWMLRTWNLTEAQKRGWWRISFSLDPEASYGEPPVTLPNNVTIVALDPSETVATLDSEHQSSVEIEITE